MFMAAKKFNAHQCSNPGDRTQGNTYVKVQVEIFLLDRLKTCKGDVMCLNCCHLMQPV
jgi:hypothetical protein